MKILLFPNINIFNIFLVCKVLLSIVLSMYIISQCIILVVGIQGGSKHGLNFFFSLNPTIFEKLKCRVLVNLLIIVHLLTFIYK